MKITRYLYQHILTDLKEKMVFIGGPRQVGKTTLSKIYIQKSQQYLNWDFLDDREIIKSHQIDTALKLVIFDEIHKYARWRILVKGLFDKFGDKISIIVTGSARLDHLRKGGDSLVGRYHYFRLHPLSLPEVDARCSQESLAQLLKFSGFPEPYQKKSETFYRRWKKERINRVVYQDLRDLDTVKELSKIELLVSMLPEKVGSTLSINSIKEDLEVSPNTVKHWIEVLESIYYCYRILPFGPKKIRAIKKANKLYLWDWAEINDPGPRFENLVASHLLKYCHFLEDTEGYKMELRFIKDIDGREIDFVVLKENKPIFAVECKTGEKNISPHLFYFRERTVIPQFYQVHLGEKKYHDKNISVLPFSDFCRIEKLV